MEKLRREGQPNQMRIIWTTGWVEPQQLLIHWGPLMVISAGDGYHPRDKWMLVTILIFVG